jgi:hypothetical protein
MNNRLVSGSTRDNRPMLVSTFTLLSRAFLVALYFTEEMLNFEPRDLDLTSQQNPSWIIVVLTKIIWFFFLLIFL